MSSCFSGFVLAQKLVRILWACAVGVVQEGSGVGRRRTHLHGRKGGYLPECRREWQGGRTPLYRAAEEGHAAVVEQLLAAGADGTAAADDGSTPRSIAQGDGVLAMLEEAQRLRCIAFAMGLQERLGAASAMRLGPDWLRMVVELVYPPVDNVL